ncbi:hypothetical protein ABEB36_000649 [Hypothenemus hampei]|uniref:RPA43 OB domain-containing protein n=1 Tax=Hypothenemus hampei TaxID=57062 RepID=A0ABD1FF76_HYPHA
MVPNHIKFDKEYLNELTNRPESGVLKRECKYHIALHPAQLNNFSESIKSELGRKIGRYEQLFNGILLGFENLKLLSSLGAIGPDNCYIHIDIQGWFFVFQPQIGLKMTGTVTRTTKNHIGCLVYNTFNISLPKPPIGEDEDWIGNGVCVNAEVEFIIDFVDLLAQLPHIRGDLIAVLKESGPCEFDGSPTKVKHKNNKITFSIDEGEVEDSQSVTTKKKKHKVKDESNFSNELLHIKSSSVHEENFDENSTHKKATKKSMKKKKHKEKYLDVSLDSLNLDSLFSNSQDFNASENINTADVKQSKKRRKSVSISKEPFSQEIKLELDSELDELIGN